MTNHPIAPLSYDPAGAGALSAADLTDLDRARKEVLKTDLELFNSGDPIAAEKQPLDAGFLELPEKILGEYRGQRDSSELGKILATAARLREAVDRVVVLGIGGSYMGARAMMDVCCHPYHNELSRGERGGRPRLYFAGNNVDNDATQGLLDLLDCAGAAVDVVDRWATIVISKSGGTLETAVALRVFLAALRKSCGGEDRLLGELVVPVTGRTGRLFELAGALGCRDMFHVPDGVGGRFSVLSAVGLLPAAMLGLDVVRLLEGAAAMNDHFRTAPPEENIVLQFAGMGHMIETRHGAATRVLSVWAHGLEAVGLWYDQLLAESLGKQGQGALPLTVVNTRDLHSRGQQHQEGARDKLITNLIVDQPRRDRLTIGPSKLDQDRLNELAGKTMPDMMAAAIAGTNQAYNEDRRATADLHLPRMDEASLGQLFQMLMLATVVEGRLIGINPYGQPGVEAYKKNMNAILRGTTD